MTRAERLQIAAASKLLDSLGIKWEVGERTRHLCINIFDSFGGRHRVQIAGTPRDEGHAVRYTEIKVRKAVTEILQLETKRRRSGHGIR